MILRFIFVILSTCITNSVLSQNYDSYFGQNETHVIQINNNYTLGMYPNRIDSLAITSNVSDHQNLTLKEVKFYRHYSPDNPIVTFYLREDQTAGKLWIRSSIDGAEFLISDMSLEVGDTTNIFSSYSSLTVSQVSYINGKKHIYFDSQFYPGGFPGVVYSSDNLFFIEGMIPFLVWDTVYQEIGYINFINGESAPVCIVKDNNQVFSIDNFWEINLPPYSYVAEWVSCELIDIYNLSNETFNNIDFEIYPNPTYSTFYIEKDNFEINQVEIFNINGKSVKTFNKNLYKINICDLAAGTYIVKIRAAHGMSAQKLVKL